MASKSSATKKKSAGKTYRGASSGSKSGSSAGTGSAKSGAAKNGSYKSGKAKSGSVKNGSYKNGGARAGSAKNGAVSGNARAKAYRVRKPAVAPAETSPIVREAVAFLLAGAAVLLFLSVYTSGGAGAAGRVIKGVLAGLLGIGAYLLPFALAGVALHSALDKSGRPGMRRGAISFSALALFLISCTHILNRSSAAAYSGFFDYIKTLYAAGSFNNGGLIGGVFGNLLASVFGRAGSVIILAVGMLASVTVLTGLSIIGGIRLIASYLRPSRYEEDEEYGEYEEYGGEALLPGGSPPGRDHTPTPGSAADAGKKRRAGVIDIPDPGRDRDGRKLALFHEEMNNGKPENPLFGSRRVDRDENWPGSGPGPDGRLPPADAGRPGGREIKLSGLVEAPGAEARRDPRGVSGDADEADNPDEADESYEDEDFRKDAFDEDEDAGESVNDRRIEGESGKDRRIEGESGNDRRIELFRKPGAPPEAKASPALKAMPEPIAFVPRERSKTADIPGGINTCADARFADYRLPPITLLKRGEQPQNVGSRAEILENSRKLEETLASFRVEAKVVEVSVGPTVTRYEMSPGQGVKVSSIANLSNDLALSLAAQGIRIEAPIPGKSAIGIEIPNKETQPVLLRDILEDEAFRNYPSKLAFAVGKDIGGSTVVADVAKMPHLLIAGATGSGKSVCIHTLIASILYKARPDEVKFIMVDPKVVELNVYNGIPHLLIPVVTDPKKAAGALNWAVIEMDRRYNLFAEQGVRDIKGYNAFKQENGEPEAVLAQIVIIIDELADLMMLAKGEVEETICRLAQKARAAGLHLIVATQRPSVDVITGLIKANIPSRLVFAVSSGTDSRTVLDMIGAEKLLGKGDMLFLPVGRNKPMRLQCGFISDREVENLVDYLKTQIPMEYDEDMIERVTDPANAVGMEGDTDEFFEEAVDFLIQKGKASASVLQRQFRIGYNRASRLIEELEARGIVGPEDGSKPRKVLIKRSEWENR